MRRGIQGTQSEFGVSVPMFYRIKGVSYPEATDSTECYARYSNALLNAAVALPEEISTRLRPVTTNTPGTDWRTFTNWVEYMAQEGKFNRILAGSIAAKTPQY